jgi:Leucine-rich repeat (LRR) protein
MTQGKISLRRSASSKMGYGILSTHPDINRMEFILMYHRIAGDNPIIKDVSPAVLDLKQQEITELPLLIKFFDGIRNINLEKNPSFDLEKSLPALKVAHNITGLNFAGNRIKVPDLSFLPSLKILDLSFNSVGDCSWLQHLSLEELNIEGCNVDSWEWLNKKNTIKVLNISGNKMDAVPEGVFAGSLTKFTCRNNKLTVIDPRFGEAEKLDEIDLAGNQIKEFSYFLLDKTIVNLRSNKIGEFDHSKYIAGNTWQEIRIMRLDLVNNELKELVFGPLMLKRLYDLKISNNKIFRLDDSVFNNTNLHIFEATNNEIEAVPESVMQHEYKNFWLNKNKIRELPEYLNALRAADIDLSDNRIEKIHPSFFTIKQASNRHYWKISGNPVSKDPAFNWHDFIYPGKE